MKSQSPLSPWYVSLVLFGALALGNFWGSPVCRAENIPRITSDSLRVFSIVSETKTEKGFGWVEEFYLMNDGDKSIPVTSASIEVKNVDPAGKADVKHGAMGIGGTSTNGKGPSKTVPPHGIWLFYTIKWVTAPSIEISCGHATFTENSSDSVRLIEVKSIPRYFKQK